VPRSALFTIGYERRSLEELVAGLHAHRIERLIDVRELPLSRRPGFSKTPLGEALVDADIEYLHLRQAGNPFRAEKDLIPRDELLAKYRRHLAGAAQAIADVVDATRGRRAALFCYEREPAECHRTILAKRVARRLGVKIVEL
jgi:uncharacterized protein (DUF488 family)